MGKPRKALLFASLIIVAATVVLSFEIAEKLMVRSEDIQCRGFEECVAKSYLLAERAIVVAVLIVLVLVLLAVALILVNLCFLERTSRSGTGISRSWTGFSRS
ncbi:MAG: hypothetical protein QXG57_09095 [Thermofilaceae archaeon]